MPTQIMRGTTDRLIPSGWADRLASRLDVQRQRLFDLELG
mgnify:CR=1 FL=1